MPVLEKQVALVTGGASGIGRATAERLAAEGARVVVADIDGDGARAVAEAVAGRAVVLDVTDPAAWHEVLDGVLHTEGGLDVVHLNAGVTTGEADLLAVSDEQYRRIMAVNVDGVVFGARAAAWVMVVNGGGVIVATASLAGLIGFPPDPVYTATKHAVVGLVRALGPALAPHGIRIQAVCPGLVDTPLLGESAALLREAGFPMMVPADIAEGVLAAIASGGTGEAWVCQPGRPPEPFAFGQVPGPRTEGAEGMAPPPWAEGTR